MHFLPRIEGRAAARRCAEASVIFEIASQSSFARNRASFSSEPFFTCGTFAGSILSEVAYFALFNLVAGWDVSYIRRAYAGPAAWETTSGTLLLS